MATFPFQVGQTDTADPTITRTPWDVVQLGQFTLPGVSTVTCSRSRKARIKGPKDKSYATIKDSGLELAKVTIVNVIINQEELDDLEGILKYFDTQLGVKVKNSNSINGFAVNHPLLQLRGVNSIYIEDVDGPHTSRPGFITTTFKCVETKPIKETGTNKVKDGKSFAQNTAFNNGPSPTPTPPSQNSAATGPKK